MHYKIVFVIPSVAIPLAASFAAYVALVVVYARTTNVLQVEDIAIVFFSFAIRRTPYNLGARSIKEAFYLLPGVLLHEGDGHNQVISELASTREIRFLSVFFAFKPPGPWTKPQCCRTNSTRYR